ncbi:MAG: LysM peptidoglycan-binding domain-containing protein, partial [Rubrimonas sp.]
MKPRPLPLAALAAVVFLAGCVERRTPAPVVFRGTQPGGAVATAPSVAAVPTPSVDMAALPGPSAAMPAPGAGADARGVINYGGYSAIVARPGDTVQTMAARAGVSAQALASYNGLPASFTPRAGDELILPPSPTGGVASGGGMEIASLDDT